MTTWKIIKKNASAFTDEEIIEGLRDRKYNRTVFENHLFDQHKGFVQQAIEKYRLSKEDALSAYADAILALIDQMEKGNFRGESKLSTYLYKIFQNKCIDQVRKNTAQQSRFQWLEEISHIGEEVKDTLDQLLARERVEQLVGLLDKLGKNCKDLLLLWGEEYSLEEIAHILQFKDAGSVKSRKYKCLKELKDSYQA